MRLIRWKRPDTLLARWSKLGKADVAVEEQKRLQCFYKKSSRLGGDFLEIQRTDLVDNHLCFAECTHNVTYIPHTTHLDGAGHYSAR